MNDERDPDSVVDDEGNVLGYRCPACETIVTSEAKAREHCSSPDPTPDSPDTTTDSQPDDRSRDANPGYESGESPSRESEESRNHRNPVDVDDGREYECDLCGRSRSTRRVDEHGREVCIECSEELRAEGVTVRQYVR
jgi:ribosomal protein L37AE/L43A